MADDRQIDLSVHAETPVAVLGLGKSGLAAAKALQRSGATVWAWDDAAAVRDRAGAAGVSLQPLDSADLREVRTLVLSPGIPHTHPAPHPVVQRARDAGCAIVSDIELLVRAQAAARYVGVTGTNGKSTTTALIGHILAAQGEPIAVGGNLGVPALSLPPLGSEGIYVLELSSYQLELTPSAVFDAAVLLNISADHLDRHGGPDGYVAAKVHIFAGQDERHTAVVGTDDARSQAVFDQLRGAGRQIVVPISAHGRVAGGVYAKDGALVDERDGDAAEILRLETAHALPGWHNAQNAAGAYAAAAAVGVAHERIAPCMTSYPGLAHRQEVIEIVDDVLYINDSKATNAEAAARALECYENVLWIAGGRAKEGGIASLAPYFPRIRHALLIGEAASPFEETLAGRVPVTQCGTLVRAVEAAAHLAAEDGMDAHVVLLSPACASFDQFASFEERGDAFRYAVQGLAGEHKHPTPSAGGAA